MKNLSAHHKFVLWVVFSLVCGLTAAWAAYKHLEQQRQLLEQQIKPKLLSRVVAAHRLPVGTILHETHLAVRDFPEQAVAADSLDPVDYQQLVGLVVRSAVAAGDPLLLAHTDKPTASAFSTRLNAGRRAITMPVDQINSLAGLLQVGDLVDLYVSFDHLRKKITAPLLQGVLVLATAENTASAFNENSTHYATVTFDLSPEEGAKLVAARQTGSITAMLRNPYDEHISHKGIRGDLATLLGINQPASHYKTVPIIYGNKNHRQIRGAEAIPEAPTSAVLNVTVPHQLSANQGDEDAWVD